MNQKSRNRWITHLVPVLLCFALTGCGGSGNGSGISPGAVVTGGGGGTTTTAGTGNVSGQGFKGPFQAGALVEAFSVVGGAKGTRLATGTTDSSGNFTLSVDPAYDGPVLIEISGIFFDEATGTTQSTVGSPLKGAISRIASGGTISNVRVTALTHIAVAVAQGRGALTESGLNQAFTDVGNRFSISSIQSSAPHDTRRTSTGVDPNSLEYGLIASGLSQVAETLNVTVATLLAAITQDVADGNLDGTNGGSALTMATRSGGTVSYSSSTLSSTLSTAIGAFIDSPQDGTGLSSTDTQVVVLQSAIFRANTAPAASLSITPAFAPLGTTVSLDGRGSKDPDGDGITYSWAATVSGQNVTITNASSPQALFLGAIAGPHAITLTVSDTFGLSSSATGQIVIATPGPASLSIAPLQSIGTVAQGQAFTAAFSVTNSGTQAATISSAALSYSGSSLTVAPRPSNSVTLAGGSSATFTFDVTAGATAATGSFTASIQVAARDVTSGADVSVSSANSGTVQVTQVPVAAPLTLGSFASTVSVVQGLGTTVAVAVTNPGADSARILSSSMSLGNSAILARPVAGNPTTLAGGATANLVFEIFVDGSVPAATYNADVQVVARSATSNLNIDGSRTRVGSLQVIEIGRLRISNLTASNSIVSQGTVVTASFTLESIGGSVVNLTTVAIDIGNLRIAPTNLPVPATLASGQSATFNFTINSSALAVAIHSINGTAAGTDATGGQAVPVVEVTLPPTLTVQKPATLAISSFTPATKTVSQGQTVRVAASVTNGGTAPSRQTTVSLLFFQGATNVSGNFTVSVVASNPTTVAGSSSGSYLFDVRPTSGGITGDVVVQATAMGQDGNDGSALVAAPATLTWKVEEASSLTLGAPLFPLTVSQGQTFRVTQSVSNTGGATLTAATGVLTVQGTGASIAATGTQLAAIPGGTTTTYTFDVTVSATAASGVRPFTFVASGKDLNSGSTVAASASPAFNVTVQTGASLTAGSSINLSKASQGQSFVVTVPVANAGQADAMVTTASLRFSGTGVTVMPRTIPATVPGLSTGVFEFNVTIGLGAELTSRTVTFSLDGSDANSGENLSISNQSVGAVTVQSPGQLVFGNIVAPSTVSLGQTFPVTIQVQNPGQAAIFSTTGTMAFSGSGLSVTARTTNPAIVAGGATLPFVFDVSVANNAASSARTASATFTAVASGTLAALSTSRADAGSITVQTTSVLSLSNIGGESIASQGQLIVVTATVTNTAQARAILSGASLTFDNNSNLTIANVAFPSSIAGGQTGTLRFNVTPASSSTPGSRTAILTVNAADGNSGVDVSQVKSPAGQITIETPAAVSANPMLSRTSASAGVTFPVTVPVTNAGQAAAKVTTAFLSYSDSGLTVTPVTIPASIPGLTTANYVYSVKVEDGAPATARTASFTLFGADQNSNNALAISAVSVGTFTVLAPPGLPFLAFDEPSEASHPGKSIPDIRVSLMAPGVVDRAGSGETLTLRVTGSGQDSPEPIGVTGAAVSFTMGSADVTDQYIVLAPDDLTTREIPGGATSDFRWSVIPLETAPKFGAVRVQIDATLGNRDNTIFRSVTAEWIVRDGADQVTGQASFDSGSRNRGTDTAANGLDLPSSVSTDGSRLAVADTQNNRVLLFDSLTDTTATRVLGQPDFSAREASTTRSGMDSPYGVHLQGNRLIVCDAGNHRVLIYDDVAALPESGGLPDRVLGQSSFVAGAANGGGVASSATMDNPLDAAFSGSTLFVADSGNHRVLVFDAFEDLPSGGAASGVIGQPNFWSNAPNGDGEVSASSLAMPVSIALSDRILAVADRNNHRVLLFDTTGDLTAASRVLGQSDFQSGSPDRGGDGASRNGLNSPQCVRFGEDRLFICDSLNNRVVWFEDHRAAGPESHFDDLLGQSLFSESLFNNAASGAMDSYSLSRPRQGSALGGSHFYVADTINSRILRFPIP